MVTYSLALCEWQKVVCAPENELHKKTPILLPGSFLEIFYNEFDELIEFSLLYETFQFLHTDLR